MSPGFASGVITATAFSAAVGRFTFAALYPEAVKSLAWGTYLTMALGNCRRRARFVGLVDGRGQYRNGLQCGRRCDVATIDVPRIFSSHYYGRIYGLIAIAVYAGGGLGPGLIGLLREATGAASALWALVVLSIAAAVAVSGLGGGDNKRRTRAG